MFDVRVGEVVFGGKVVDHIFMGLTDERKEEVALGLILLEEGGERFPIVISAEGGKLVKFRPFCFEEVEELVNWLRRIVRGSESKEGSQLVYERESSISVVGVLKVLPDFSRSVQ